MKILVTGASGFVGSHLVPCLLAAGNNVVAAGRSEEGLKAVFPDREERLTLASTSYDDDGLARLFQEHEIEAVVHLAAERYSRSRPDRLEDYVEPNLLLTERIFGIAACHDIKNIIFMSSIAVYSPANSLPFSENEPPRPDNFYGLSKLMGEELAQLYNRNHGMQIKSIRVAQLLGKGERDGYMLSTFIENAIKGVPLPIWGEGKGARDYLYIDDLNTAILATLSYQSGGTFNIGSGEPTTHLDLAEAINRVFNNEAGIQMEKTNKEDKAIRYLHISGTERDLGWRPIFDLVDGLEEIKKIP